MKKPLFFLITFFITIPCIADDCFTEIDPVYSVWVDWGRPACWCYPRQCNGDIDGVSFLGKPVTGVDLIIFKAAFNKTDAELALVPDGICADLNHSSFLGKRVSLADLIIFKAYFLQPESQVPEDCYEPCLTYPWCP